MQGPPGSDPIEHGLHWRGWLDGGRHHGAVRQGGVGQLAGGALGGQVGDVVEHDGYFPSSSFVLARSVNGALGHFQGGRSFVPVPEVPIPAIAGVMVNEASSHVERDQ